MTVVTMSEIEARQDHRHCLSVRLSVRYDSDMLRRRPGCDRRSYGMRRLDYRRYS